MSRVWVTSSVFSRGRARYIALILGFIALVIGNNTAWAEPFSCDWLKNTESSSIMVGGSYGFEFGWSYARIHSNEVDQEQEQNSGPAILARVGFSSRYELRLAWEGYQWYSVEEPNLDVNHKNGPGDGDIALKAFLFPGENFVPEMACLIRLPLRSGEKNHVRPEYNPTLMFCASWTLGRAFTVTGNIGTTFISLQDESYRSDSITYLNNSLALTYRMQDWLDLFAELYSDVPASSKDHSHTYAGLGWTYRFHERWLGSLYAGTALTEDDCDLLLRMSLAIWLG
ncbi:transporter [bacterium]|nr:transporter [bacterium]